MKATHHQPEAIPKREIGLLIGTDFAYGRNVWRGVGQYVREKGRPWIFHGVRYNIADADALQHLKLCNVEGIIAHIVHPAIVRPLRQMRIPIVSTASSVRNLPFPQVGTSDVAVGQMAAEYFMDLGYQHFAYVGASNLLYACQRGDGFRQALAAKGFRCHTYEPALGIRRNQERFLWSNTADRRCRAWLAGLPQPVALFTSNDERAMQISEDALAIGIKVPEELAILGVDDDDLLCDFATPALSSVQIPGQAIGFEAARLLDEMISGAKSPRAPLRLHPSGITARQSTDALLVGDPMLARALRFIREHVAERINVSDVVKVVPVCRTLLERKFRAALGRSPLEEIHRLRIERAKQALAGTKVPMRQVAALSGFRDEKHLHAAFVHAVGLPPSQFRRKFDPR